MEQTQLLQWDEDGDPPRVEATNEAPRPVGRLHLLSSKYGPEQDFWIYPGENVVGRLQSCRVCLPAPSVSKAHAVIEVPVPGGPHLLYDQNSLNRTRRQRVVLLPHVRYSLEDGDTLMFGDVGCQYFLLPTEGADPEDSLEVPPTQPRPPNNLAIEETPAPSKRMGYGALLARDSEDEEELQGGGRLLHLPGSNGSNSSIDIGRRSDAAFSSPSATVVPESDEEGGETPDAPCPSLRLCYSSEKATENRVALVGPEEPGATGVAGTDPEAEERTGLRGPTLAAFHLAGPSHAGWGPANAPERAAVRGLGNGCPMEVEDDTDVEEEVQHPHGGQKNHGPAFLGDSNANVEEAAGSPEVVDPTSPQPAIEVGSDTDVEEETAHPDVGKDHHQHALHGDSDTDVEAALANPDVVQGMKSQPAASEDGDTDVEEAGVKPNVVGLKSHQPRAEVGSDTDVEEAAKSPDIVQNNHQLAVPGGGKTEVEGGVENPDDGHRKSCHSAENGDSDTDVEKVKENPEVAQKALQPAMEVDSDTVVEEEKAENPEVVQKAPQPAMEVGSDTDVEEENPEVVQKAPQLAIEVSSDTDVEEKVENPEVAQKAHQPAMELGSDTDVEEEKTENPEVGKADVQPTSNELAALADSDTDVEEADGNPDVAAKSHWPAVDGDSDTDVEEEAAKSPDVVTKTHQDALLESSYTDVMGTVGKLGVVHPKGHQPAENGDSDTDVEEAAKHPAVTQLESGGCSDTDVEDDADFALQATQCYLAEETPSLGVEAARNPAAAESVMLPPAGLALHAPVCASSEKEDDSDTDPCMVEATQSFCEDPGRLLDQPTQAFIPEEEEETQLLPHHAPPGGALSAEPAPPAVSSPASGGPLLPHGPQAAPSPEGGLECPGGMLPEGGARREPPEEEESQPMRLVQSAPRRPGSALRGESRRAGAEPRGGRSGRRAQRTRGKAEPKAAKTQETLEAAGITGATAHPMGAQPEDAGKVTATETHPIASTTSRRRSLRSAPVPAPPSPDPAPAPERRSRRSGAGSGRQGEEESGERSQPGTVAPPRKGRRQLCTPSVYTVAPEPGAEEVEQSGSIKRPRRGTGSQAPPTKPEASGRARRSRGAADVEPGPAGVPQGAEPGVQQGQARRSQRAPTQEPAARRRGAPEAAGEAQGKGRGVAVLEPLRAQGPEVAGSCTSQEQEAPAPRLHRQSAEKEAEAPRARAPRRSQGAASPVASPRVLFTGVIDEAGERMVSALGGTLARSVFDCTHLVTDRVRRTVKFLCALARGVPIVSLGWLDKSGRSGCFLSPSSFLVRDAEQEQKFNFSLTQSLQRARGGALLQGYEIHVTPNVKPEPEHMKDIIQCSGGVFLPHMPRAYKDQRIVISCPEDLPRCKPALSARLPIASAELILTGILQQTLDLAPYRLDDSPPLPSPAAPTTRSSKRKGASGPATALPSSAKRRR